MLTRTIRHFVPSLDALEFRLPPSGMALESAAVADVFDPDKVPPDVDPDHFKDLGTDPATGGFRQDEADTGVRLEKDLGKPLKRYTPPGNPGDKGDFVDATGKRYDKIRTAPTAQFGQQWDNFKTQLDDHFKKTDVVVIDMKDPNIAGLTPPQEQQLEDYLDALPKAQKDALKILR